MVCPWISLMSGSTPEEFIDYLKLHAPEDWQGFVDIVTAIGDGVGREELIAEIAALYPEWKQTVVATNTAGHVARCREWGLVAPQQFQRQYVLTDFGFEFKKETS